MKSSTQKVETQTTPTITILVTKYDSDKCYVCLEDKIDDCFDCYKPICKKHATEVEHFCKWESNHCPDCYLKREAKYGY